ncbi:COBRA-like protein 2 isoform X4 [Tanacetum coccineum]
MPTPEIVDLMPDAKPINSPENCCRGGLLAASAINPRESSSSFDIVVGNIQGNSSLQKPVDLTLLAPGPGYTCSPIEDTQPTVSIVVGGRREEEVFTQKSRHALNAAAGADQQTRKHYPALGSGSSNSEFVTSLDTLRCTDHMCPLRVHWHIKTNYLDHWRVKLTVTNLNYNRSYTNWNVLVHHPGLSQPATTYSFNTTLLHTTGILDDVALFWGIGNYNTELLNADQDEVGSVSTEILLAKDHKTFTLHNGWALPRTIYFAGENCVMPSPNTYPMLPNDSSTHRPLASLILTIIIYLNFKLQRV